MVRACVCVRSLLVVVFASLIPLIANAQFAEQNVNMVSGTQWPGGDPFLRQQNEPSLAVSTRNPLHLLAVANDYRSVDIPFLAPAGQDLEERGDAWLGVFKSKDGGNKWFSILLDGYPQQANLASPLNGFQAAADGVVRAGNNGMFYMTGIVLNRGTNPASGVLLARFIDNNNSEVGDPIVPIDTKLIDQGSSGQFIDKPWLAVAPSTNGGQCTLAGQTFPAQNVYLAYTVFVGNDINVRTKIMFARSTNCGATWSTQKLSEMYSINQGPTIAIDPNNPSKVYVAWRRFKGGNDTDSIIFTKSTDGGATFTKGAIATNITPFEQGTTGAAIRTNAYATMAVDASGRIYMAWSQKFPTVVNSIDPNTFDGRIVLISSADGISWSPSPPLQVSPIMGGTSNGRGHQFMPTMTFAAGKLTLAWYDMRQDHTRGKYSSHTPFDGIYDESRDYASPGNLPGQPTVVFWQYLSDTSPPDIGIKLNRRHTLEIYAVESVNLGLIPTFTTSARVSRYKFGSVSATDPIHDLQLNPPNLPMFRQGTVPFFGDYIDLAAYISPVSGTTSTVPTRVRHVVWTDNRDVRAPLGSPPDWTKYTPVHYGNSNTSIFDPTQSRSTWPCTVEPLSQQSPYAGTRNQNIYTARVTDGMFAGSPGNAKPLGVIQRAFTVFVQNARNAVSFYRLSFGPLPANTTASFHQFDAADSEDVAIPPHSTATRAVFVTGPAHSRVDVTITEITMVGFGGTEVPGGLSTDVGLNTDPQNPDIGNPDIGNPDIGNQEVFNPDIGNPDIGNPDIGNPDIGNPDIGNPDIGNPDIGNPDIGNPDIGNPDIGNPDIGNPDIGNPDIGNQSVSDTNIPVQNNGNTTGGYTIKLLKNGDLPPSVTGTQLILSKTYDTPTARGCDLGVEHHRQIVTSVKSPLVFTNPGDATNPSLDDPASATIWLAPGETGNITLRLIGTFPKDMKIDASQFITPVAIAHSVNTADAGPNGSHAPSVSISISPSRLPDALIGMEGGYSYTLQAVGGVDPKTWSGGAGLPPGFTLNAAGVVSGTPTTPGSFPFSATVTGTIPPRSHTSTIQFRVVDRLTIPQQTLANAALTSPYTATLTRAGGVAPFVWSLNDSSLPAGLSLAPNGVISGTPTSGGTVQFSVLVQDATYPTRQTAFGALTLTVDTITVQGTLTYNGNRRTPTATPQFFLRNEGTGQQQDANISWTGGDTFTISGLPVGNFGVEVISNENPDNELNYPGDFYSFTTFNSVSASDGGFLVRLTRLIHLTLPIDNAAAFAEPLVCPPTLSAVAPTQVSWEAIDVPATTYHWRIDRMTCGVFPGVQVVFGSTTGTSATFDPLPPNAANEYYLLTIDAYSPTQIYVGQIMTHGTTWYGWDLRFVVQSPIQ